MLEWKWWLIGGGISILGFMLLSRSIKKPLLWIWYGLLYSAIGALALYVVNIAGQYVDLYVPINPITAIISGVLGIPGIAYLFAVQIFIFGG